MLFEPLRVGPRTLRNRFVMTPHGGRIPGHRYVRYLAERAAAGVAMVVTPVGDSIYGHRTYPPEVGRLPEGYQHDVDAVLPDQRTPAGQTLFDRSVAAFRAQVAAVHEQGALLVGQLHHNTAERTTDNLQPTVAPSAIRGEHPAQVPTPSPPASCATCSTTTCARAGAPSTRAWTASRSTPRTATS